ncbi:hypothetical protein AAC387_Pa03g3804 [Persea americana]
MDKTWMTLDSQDRTVRMSQDYWDGVKSFIEFAKANAGDATEIWCPCRFARTIAVCGPSYLCRTTCHHEC